MAGRVVGAVLARGEDGNVELRDPEAATGLAGPPRPLFPYIPLAQVRCVFQAAFSGPPIRFSSAAMPDDASSLTHLHPEGGVRMVDVGAKPASVRTATAAGRVHLGPEAFRAVASGTVEKGNVLCVAQLAGIQAAKRASELIPLCHAVALAGVEVTFEAREEDFSIETRARVRTVGQTGVEMEALAAASVACLALYDMCKAISKDIFITDIRLLAKEGGASGRYERAPEADSR